MVVLKKGDKVVTLKTAFHCHVHGGDVRVQIDRRSADDYAKLWELGGRVETRNFTGVWMIVPNAAVGNV